MRRGVVILIFSLLLLGSGLYALAQGPSGQLHAWPHVPVRCALALACFFIAGIMGTAGMVFQRLACRRLVRTIRGMEADEPLGRIASPHPDLSSLVHAINALVERADRAVAEAAMRVKELQIQLKVVTAERQHAEAIIYSISDAVLVTDPFDEVVLANDQAARTFNFDLAGASRAPIERIVSDQLMVSLIREMRQSNSRNGRRIIEHKVPSSLGERTFKVTLSNVAAGEDRPAGVVAVLHDMTREKEVAEMKNDFVSNVSHELRTPLASIKAYAEMLIDGEATDDKTRTEFYEVIHNEANRLGRLIDNILNISRIESGLVKVNRRALSPSVVLKEAVDVIAAQTKQKNITIEELISPALYQTLADRDMLYEALLNLLSNAVKYTPEGGRITVQTAVDEERRTVSVRITDTGVGIPPKDLPFVFDKFYRSEANNKMAKGTGLGLSLVKHIIENVHHGRMFVESCVGKGSTFGFELDLID